MVKHEMIKAIAEKANTTKADALRIYDAACETIVEELKNGNDFTLQGVGTFHVVDVAEHSGRNPATGESMVVPAKKALKFKPSLSIKKGLNPETGQK